MQFSNSRKVTQVTWESILEPGNGTPLLGNKIFAEKGSTWYKNRGHVITTVMAILVILGGCSAYPGKIHDAIRGGDVEKVRAILTEHSKWINARERDGSTPLHLAAGFGYKEIAEILLANDAQLNARDKEGQTPLYWAARQGHREIVELLLAHGADVDAKDTAGMSASQVTAEWGYQEVVQVLAKYHAKDAITLMTIKIPDLPKVEPVVLPASAQKEPVAQATPSSLSTNNLPPTSCGCGGAK